LISFCLMSELMSLLLTTIASKFLKGAGSF
jgi:hypothetical protein